MRTSTSILLGFFLSATAGAAAGEDAAAILKKADDVRNPAQSYHLVVSVESKGEDLAEFDVSIKGKDKTLTKTLQPVRDRGKSILMMGEDMWVFIPNLKRAVRVSLNQKLSGQAANGDICRQRWSGDYDATIENESGGQWTLDLKASKKGVTYERIRLWVEKKSYHPLKAEYLTKSGKVLKRASFEAYKMLEGRERPSETRIVSATKANDVSVIKIIEMKKKEFSEALFDQNSLK